jgi:CYTH domain-containing protein
MEKYSCIERERKFVIHADHVPVTNLYARLITDHYVPGTSIRFRAVLSDGITTYKLTKKVPMQLKGETEITTIYLSEHEYLVLNTLNAVKVKKTRYTWSYESLIIGFDHYNSPQDDLWIAEIEFSSYEEMNDFIMPIPVVKEVTSDELFNGFELAKRFAVNSDGISTKAQ